MIDKNRLIAIMLGRLEMDVEECIAAYIKLMGSVFDKQIRHWPVNLRGRIEPRFDSNRLKEAIEEVAAMANMSASDPFNDGRARGCRVQVYTRDLLV